MINSLKVDLKFAEWWATTYTLSKQIHDVRRNTLWQWRQAGNRHAGNWNVDICADN